jgi:hypothetical protein
LLLTWHVYLCSRVRFNTLKTLNDEKSFKTSFRSNLNGRGRRSKKIVNRVKAGGVKGKSLETQQND